jgi:hypothetical protein
MPMKLIKIKIKGSISGKKVQNAVKFDNININLISQINKKILWRDDTLVPNIHVADEYLQPTTARNQL